MLKRNILTIEDYPTLNCAITGDKGILKAIELCHKEKMYLPALIITYVGIDTMSHISMPENKAKHEKDDFIKWVEKYMKFRNGKNYPGKEVYSARCSMLHYMSGESNLSYHKNPDKKTHIISYAFGIEGKDEIVKEDAKHIIFGIEPLINSFKKGVWDCLTEILSDKRKSEIAEQQLRKLYNIYSASSYQLKK